MSPDERLRCARELYRQRYASGQGAAGWPDYQAIVDTEELITRRGRLAGRYRCEPCGWVFVGGQGVQSHCRGARHLAAVFRVEAADVAEGTSWLPPAAARVERSAGREG